LLLPEPGRDGETYLIAAHAARVFAVAPSTFAGWVRKGYLGPVPGSSGRLYRLTDIARAEKLAHDAAVRTSGSAKRVQRVRQAALPVICWMCRQGRCGECPAVAQQLAAELDPPPGVSPRCGLWCDCGHEPRTPRGAACVSAR
jgi:hypothetical protein